MLNEYLKLDNLDLVKCAYRKLKQSSYYDNVDLFLRKAIASFETKNDFSERLETVSEILQELKDSSLSSDNVVLDKWLGKINFNCLPKSLKNNETKESVGILISNVRSLKEYKLDGVNYFIDAPIELQIIDTIWSMTAGSILDTKLDKNCLGNRLESQTVPIRPECAASLFKFFPPQYSMWRDKTIETALSNLQQKNDIVIIGLDLKQCYYHLEADWKEIRKIFKNKSPNNNFLIGITDLIENIFNKYHLKAESYLNHSHKTAVGIKGLPVGLSSSKIIANWMLNRFDQLAKKKLKPVYYGRYVDDILMVVPSPGKALMRKGNNTVLKKLFLDTKLFEKAVNDKESDFQLSVLKKLAIQGKKLIIQYFEHSQSHAGLKEFRRSIDEQASEFRFLPVGDNKRSLDECAFDVIYKGSVNKLRSVIGLEENSTELSKYLSRRIIQHRLSADGFKKKHVDQLFRFYNGKNIFDFCRLWEKVFTLLLTNNRKADCARFFNKCQKTITKLKHDHIPLEKKIIEDANIYLEIALSVPLGLLDQNNLNTVESKKLKEIIESTTDGKNLCESALQFRNANMIRHGFVAYPLVNYTDYQGSLLEFTQGLYEKIDTWSIKEKQKLSPRFIHHDEIQLFYFLKEIIENPEKLNVREIYKISKQNYNKNSYYDISHASYKIKEEESTVKASHICICNSLKNQDVLQIGIANLKVNLNDIQNNCNPTRKANLNFKRQEVLYQLINDAVKEPKCDLIVLPEVSVPVAWFPFMVNQARRHQIGIVFGLEHWVVNGIALNLVATILPYEIKAKYKSTFVSLRPKNYYAPDEIKQIKDQKLSVPKIDKPYYEKFCWMGCVFSVYNCFELSNIHNRGLFRSELDFLISVLWNRDTHYYANIIQSSVRDLHCYIIQANTSDYGDSRISAPKKTVEMDMVRVKGGSPTLLKAELDIKALKEFQRGEKNHNFKPLPAGYDKDRVNKRANKPLHCGFFKKVF